MLSPSLGASISPEMEGANLRTSLKAFNRVKYKKFKTILIFSRKTHVLTMKRNLERISPFV